MWLKLCPKPPWHAAGGSPNAADGPYAWGLCFDEEQTSATYCQPGSFPCASGISYHGRGPIQLFLVRQLHSACCRALSAKQPASFDGKPAANIRLQRASAHMCMVA